MSSLNEYLGVTNLGADAEALVLAAWASNGKAIVYKIPDWMTDGDLIRIRHATSLAHIDIGSAGSLLHKGEVQTLSRARSILGL